MSAAAAPEARRVGLVERVAVSALLRGHHFAPGFTRRLRPSLVRHFGRRRREQRAAEVLRRGDAVGRDQPTNKCGRQI